MVRVPVVAGVHGAGLLDKSLARPENNGRLSFDFQREMPFEHVDDDRPAVTGQRWLCKGVRPPGANVAVITRSSCIAVAGMPATALSRRTTTGAASGPMIGNPGARGALRCAWASVAIITAAPGS